MDRFEKIVNLRKELNKYPGLSWNEKEAMEIIKKFIRENSDMKIVETDKWFYAIHKEKSAKKNIAFRADLDAIKNEDDSLYHGCGHDGHSAILAGLAILLENENLNKNIYFIFQPAEEVGEGAFLVKDIIEKENIGEIYGFHNIPEYEENLILLKKDVFACTSTGLTIKLKGRQSHAAYPERGLNPAYVIGDLINNLENFRENKEYSGSVIVTIINISVGDKTFGTSPANGEISLTIRAHYEEDLSILEKLIENFVIEKSKDLKIDYDFVYTDEFPATINSEELFNKVESLVISQNYKYQILKEPFRWSEDFGYYSKKTKGFYFGVGCGINHPQLHTKDYQFNDNIIKNIIALLKDIAKDS